jgi:toxin CptA
MLNIRLKNSVYLAILLGVAHFIAAGLVLVLPLPIWLKLVAILAFCISLVIYLNRDARLAAPNSIIALEIKEDGSCTAETRSGKQLDCTLLSTSYVSARLTILNLKASGGLRARHVVIVPDRIDAEDFRKLRVLLRWKFKAKPVSPI